VPAKEDEFGKPRPERRRQGVVGVVSEALVSPECVRRVFTIAGAPAQPAQACDVAIADPAIVERTRQHIAVELRIGARSRHLAHIDDHVGADRLKRSATSSTDRVECPIVKNGRIPPSASPNMPMLPAASGADASTRYHRDDRAEHHDAGPTRETANVGISPQKGPAQSMKSTTLTPISHGPPLETLLSEIRGCRACADEFAHEPRPVVWVKPETRLLI